MTHREVYEEEREKSELLPRAAEAPSGLKDISPAGETSWQERLGRALAGWDHNHRAIKGLDFKKGLTRGAKSTKL